MSASPLNRLAVSATLALAGSLGLAPAALAAPDVVIDLPAGLACAGFDLRIEIVGGVQVNKQFMDKNGNTVRMLSAGKGSQLTFINLNTGAQLLVKPSGSVTQFRPNADGSTTAQSTGHNVVILFPTDVPAGPSTVQYIGRVTYTVDSSGVFTIRNVSGQSTDICAALS
jgi:hypothetical protein